MSKPPGLRTVFDDLALENVKAGHVEGVAKLLAELTPEVKRLTIESQEAADARQGLVQTLQERTKQFHEAEDKFKEASWAFQKEGAYNPGYDVGSGFQGVVSRRRKVEALRQIVDCILEVLLPAAEDKNLEITRDLHRFEYLETSLHTAYSHATLLTQLERAGLNESHGRIVAYSETTEQLKRATELAQRKAEESDKALAEFRAARLVRQQQRQASGQTTRAEAVFAAFELSRSNQQMEKQQ